MDPDRKKKKRRMNAEALTQNTERFECEYNVDSIQCFPAWRSRLSDGFAKRNPSGSQVN